MPNLKKMQHNWSLVLAIAGAGLCGVANAGPMTWTDYYDFNPDRYLTAGDTAWIDHEITDGPNGFNTSTDDVSNYQLVFNLYDDRDTLWDSSEYAVAWLG